MDNPETLVTLCIKDTGRTILPVSLDCPFLIAPLVFSITFICFVCLRPVSFVHNIASFSGLFLFCFSSCCVPYVASFSVFLFCFSSSCVPYVASFSVFLFCFSSSCVLYVASFFVLFLFWFSSSCLSFVANKNTEKLAT
jgi:hypothetical protein